MVAFSAGSLSLWKYRNRCVFHGASPSLGRTLLLASEELHPVGNSWSKRYFLPLRSTAGRQLRPTAGCGRFFFLLLKAHMCI